MCVGYLGPEGTFTHEAALAGSRDLTDRELIPRPTIYDVVLDIAEGRLDCGVVPIENSIEGSVSATLDALVTDGVEVLIVAEQVHRIEQCLIAASSASLSEITTVVSHPQAIAQCAHFLHEKLPGAVVLTATSTAEAVRTVSEHGTGWAAIGPRLAAQRYGCVLILEGVEDRAGNATRFVWLTRPGARHPHAPAADGLPASADGSIPGSSDRESCRHDERRWKTSLVFWGEGTNQAGWLVRCLSELSSRGVNLTRIESRPRKQGLGLYMFFVDCEGTREDPAVEAALDGLGTHTEMLRVLGCYPTAEWS